MKMKLLTADYGHWTYSFSSQRQGQERYKQESNHIRKHHCQLLIFSLKYKVG